MRQNEPRGAWKRRARLMVVLSTTALLHACAREAGTAQPPAPAADASEVQEGSGRQELSRLDALEHDLEVSEQRLEEHLSAAGEPDRASEGSEGVAADSPPMDQSEGEAEAPAAPAPAPPATESRRARKSEQDRDLQRADDVCSLSCRALASMRRAAEGICELLPASPRCVSANGRVERARQRVESAGCECAF